GLPTALTVVAAPPPVEQLADPVNIVLVNLNVWKPFGLLPAEPPFRVLTVTLASVNLISAVYFEFRPTAVTTKATPMSLLLMINSLFVNLPVRSDLALRLS